MSNEPQLLGYSVDEDTHDDKDNDDALSNGALTAGPERADPALSTSVGDAITSAPIVPSPTPLDSTRSSQTPPSQQEEGEHLVDTQATPTTPPLPERPPVDEFADPKISGLHAIFPDFDAAILYSVVDSVDGDQDHAVDALLAMSDPDHVPAHQAAANEQQPSQVEQTQLDEELARRLLLEDEEQYARDQIALRQQQEQMRQFPYAQRTNAPIHRIDTAQQQQQQQQQLEPQQRDTMSDMQEQFSKLAETGKRTFTSFVSKVKAKVQEYDQQRNTSNTSPTGSGASAAGSYLAQPPSPALDRHTQQAYYAPRVSPKPQSGTINNDSTNPPLLSSSVDGDSSASTPPPPATSSGRPVSNIDPGKIGLLPKRPVSLVNTESQSSHSHNEEEEELEYVENPFEEGKYS